MEKLPKSEKEVQLEELAKKYNVPVEKIKERVLREMKHQRHANMRKDVTKVVKIFGDKKLEVEE